MSALLPKKKNKNHTSQTSTTMAQDRPVANHFDWALQHSLRHENKVSHSEFYDECVGANGGAYIFCLQFIYYLHQTHTEVETPPTNSDKNNVVDGYMPSLSVLTRRIRCVRLTYLFGPLDHRLLSSLGGYCRS